MRSRIEDLQAFCRYHGLPVPDGLVASAEGGINLKRPERYKVIEIKSTTTAKTGKERSDA